MELKIHIDDDKFNDIVKKELDALTPDQIKEVVIDGIRRAITDNPKMVEGIFVTSSYNGGKEPTKLMQNIIKKVDIEKDIKELSDALKKELIENSNEILCRVLFNMLAAGAAGAISNQGWFEEAFYRMHHQAHDNN